MRVALAHNLNTPQEALDRLAVDERKTVRNAVKANPNYQPDTQGIFVSDPDNKDNQE